MPEREAPTSLLVLGLGNVLCGDDGLGVAAVHRLHRDWEAPEGVRVLDGGTLGMSLLPWLRDAGRVLLVDAVRTEDPPGSPVRLAGRDVGPAVLERLSVHQIGVADLLDAARWLGDLPDRLLLLGLVPEDLSLGLGCTPRVRRGLAGLVDRIVAEAGQWGYVFHRRSGDAQVPLDGAGDASRALGL